jgi:FkbM family methyltransferase
MYTSLKNLYSHPFNKNHKKFALRRFFVWKLIRVFKIENYEYTLWGNRKIVLNHDSFQSMWLMYNYIVDWEEFNLIQDYCRPSDNVADIGTNIGFYTIWMSNYIDSNGTIHCFEPDKNNFEKLERNCKINNIVQCKLNNSAVADIDGQLFFTLGKDGENSISKTTENAIKVKSVKLDTYFENYCNRPFNYVKVDIEGFELLLLKGANNLLQNKKIEILQIELNSAISNSGYEIEDVLSLLASKNMVLCFYDVQSKCLKQIKYTKKRENYFAVFDINSVNKRIMENKTKINSLI